jgi:hypothetical protein
MSQNDAIILKTRSKSTHFFILQNTISFSQHSAFNKVYKLIIKNNEFFDQSKCSSCYRLLKHKHSLRYLTYLVTH